MNRFEKISKTSEEAELKYMDGEFQVLRPGDFVRCAVTNTPIPIANLKYWSVSLQEPPSSPKADQITLCSCSTNWDSPSGASCSEMTMGFDLVLSSPNMSGPFGIRNQSFSVVTSVALDDSAAASRDLASSVRNR